MQERLLTGPTRSLPRPECAIERCPCPVLPCTPIPGFEGRYRVSFFGHVCSFNKFDSGAWVVAQTAQTVLRPQRRMRANRRLSYLRVNLRDGSGRTATFLLHSLVLLSFRGPPPHADMEATHLDEDLLNCALNNLRWSLRSENHVHERAHGLSSAARVRRFTVTEVLQIRALLLARVPHRKIARLLSCTNGAIGNISTGRCWKEIIA